MKYRVPEGGDADAATEAVWREKKREDRLRRRVDVARWTWEVALDRRRLAARLAEHGIHPLPTNTWIDLGTQAAESGAPRQLRAVPSPASAECT